MRYILVVGVLLLLALTGGVSAAVWQIETVDSDLAVGMYTSIALDGASSPRIAYWNDTYTMLRYAWHDGEAWRIETVADPSYTGKYTSLRLAPDGSPAIAYRDEWARILRFAWRDDAGWQTEIVDSRSNMGQSASLALAPNGTPRISYNDGPNSWLLYAWRDAGGWHNEVADGSLGVGSGCSLALSADGSPRISYHDGLNRDLKYAWRDGDGWHTETVDSPGTVGTETSLAIDPAGRPGIAYWDLTNADLKYAWKDDAGWHVETVDASGYVGEYPSLAFDQSGGPRIGYYGLNPTYAWRDAGGWHIAPLPNTVWAGEYTSLALDPVGAPFLSYYDRTNADLKLARGSLPEPAFSVDPATELGPLSVRCTDASRGEVTSWAWEFGDGSTAPDRNPVHAYAETGIYTLTLTVGNAAGPARAAQVVAVTAPRQANFTWTPAAPAPGEAVAFTDTSTGDPITWEWDFGDGARAFEQHPVHAFASPGNFTVRLTAYFPGSEIGRDAARAVTVAFLPPLANFTATPANGTAPLAVNFTDTSTGSPSNWSWDFGDGATSNARNPAHVFASPGNYTVTLTVANGAGSNSTARAVTVRDPPPIGGSRAFLLVSTVPSGAEVSLRFVGGALEPVGNTSAGPLNVTLYLTGTPVTAVVANLTGYAGAVHNLTGYPDPGETIAVNLTLAPALSPVPPSALLPTDPDGDGLYDDINGNGRRDFADVVLYFNQVAWIAANEQVAAFDCNGNGRIDFADVVWLFNRL